MKNKKLSLQKEIVRNLVASDLEQIFGGNKGGLGPVSSVRPPVHGPVSSAKPPVHGHGHKPIATSSVHQHPIQPTSSVMRPVGGKH